MDGNLEPNSMKKVEPFYLIAELRGKKKNIKFPFSLFTYGLIQRRWHLWCMHDEVFVLVPPAACRQPLEVDAGAAKTHLHVKI